MFKRPHDSVKMIYFLPNVLILHIMVQCMMECWSSRPLTSSPPTKSPPTRLALGCYKVAPWQCTSAPSARYRDYPTDSPVVMTVSCQLSSNMPVAAPHTSWLSQPLGNTYNHMQMIHASSTFVPAYLLFFPFNQKRENIIWICLLKAIALHTCLHGFAAENPPNYSLASSICCRINHLAV